MAVSSIMKNFIIEGEDAINFANSLDKAIKEKEKRGNFIQTGIFTSDKQKIREVADRIFRHT